MTLGLLSLGPGMALEVSYLIRKAACFKLMAGCLEPINNKLKLHIDLMPLYLELAALVIVAAVLLHFSDGLAEGVKGGTRTNNEVVEPGQHRISSVGCIVMYEIKVDGEGLLVISCPSQEIHLSVVSSLDPLSILISSADRDLGGDLSSIGFIPVGHLNIIVLVLEVNCKLPDLVI